MAAFSLFRGTNMAVVTSSENRELHGSPFYQGKTCEIREKLSVFSVVLYNYILENMLSFNMHTLFRFFWQQTTRNTSFFERKFYVAFYDALSYTQMRLRSRTLRPSLSSQLD